MAFPADLGVLVGLEAVAARHLEIDLLLEQHRRLAEQRAGPPEQLRAMHQSVKIAMEAVEILESRQHLTAGLQQRVLMVEPDAAGRLVHRFQLVDGSH